jgi:hypothetical protein
MWRIETYAGGGVSGLVYLRFGRKRYQKEKKPKEPRKTSLHGKMTKQQNVK